MSDMVGYFNTTDGSRTAPDQVPPLMEPHSTGGELPPDAPVKRVVCSPDLPVFSLTQAFEEAACEASSTAAATTTTTPDKVYQCSFCQKTFSQKNTYQNHLRSHGKEGEDPYQCNICGKTFAVPARLTRHYRTHTGEKPYQCEYCNKSFSVKENLSVHRRIHTKERPYKCDICERAFEHSGKLHRHMRIHTGERPHKCAICAKTFIQSGQLVIHMRTHTGEKPYVCKVCGKGFTCSKQLKVHTRTHTGEKPYTCDICGKSFGYNHVLKLHQVAHFGEKVYKCTICNETFTNKKTMEVHIKSHSEPTAIARSPLPPGRPDMVESSCASSSSDKENKADSDCEPPPRAPSLANSSASEFDPPSPVMVIPVPFSQPLPPQAHPHPNMSELCHYLYPRSPPYQQHGVNPVLLAAAAAAAASEGRSLSPLPHMERQHEAESHLPVTEPSVYLCPEPLASIQRRSPYHFQLPPPEYLEEPPVLINLPLAPTYRGRRREDHRSPEPMLTPPSSNPVSPVPSSSPDPIDLAIVNRQVLSLPPRKRSKMILQSMETAESEMASVRYSSVIHYAKAS